MPVPPPDLNRAFIEQLALSFPDQDLLRQAFEYDPGDVRGTAAASTNHRTGLQYHRFVQKAMRTEQQAGRSHRVTARSRPLHHSLPRWVNWLCETYPFTFTPSGAVVKKLLDGTVDPDNMRPTADFSWGKDCCPLSEMVLSPNGSIDVKALPHFEWFRLRHFIEQVHYLKQFGLPLECNKVDFSKFYRHFVLVAAAVPSHMQIWTDEEDGTHLVKDDRMNFGDAAAANISSRLTGLVVWCLHLVTDKLCPVALAAADTSKTSPRWRRLINWYKRVHQLREEGYDIEDPVLHFTNLFIDDTPGVQIAGLGRAVLALFTALLSLFNLNVQAKKLLPEGNFTTR